MVSRNSASGSESMTIPPPSCKVKQFPSATRVRMAILRSKSPLPVKALGSFPGSLGRYAGIERNIPVITVELRMAKVVPDHKAIEELFHYVLNSKESGIQRVVR